MWLVRVALERPYTFVVLGLLVLIMSTVAISNTPTDIFPNINIPVVAVDWTYTGLDAYAPQTNARLIAGLDCVTFVKP
jgi:multidrug efflux pump subunit AcrB